MSNYKNTSGGWRKREMEDGVEGTEVYVEDTTGSAFPSIVLGSTAFYDQQGGTTIANCIATSIEYTYDDGDTGTKRKAVVYSSKRGGAGAGGSIRDTGQQRYDVGIEVITIDQKKNTDANKWTWGASGIEVNQPVHRNVAVGNFTLSVIKTSQTAAETQFENMLAAAGKISSAVINLPVVKKIPKGCVLFLGGSGGTRRNSLGNLEWAWDLNFAYRIINSTGFSDSGTIGHWNYLFRNDSDANGGWDYPVLGGSQYLYATVDMSTIT